MADRFREIRELERKLLWLASWTIHNANHLREKTDDLKVGGHQASCASMTTIMAALYFRSLRPEDRVAVKPHASPLLHAINYLMGRVDRTYLENFRTPSGAQSYPSVTKDQGGVDISTGSVGLGVALTGFNALVQDYLRSKPWAANTKRGRMIALVGDAELDEGNVFEMLQESWKHDLRNIWWIIDYNRQSLDGIVAEGLYDRLARIFDAFGWRVVTIKYGRLMSEVFARPGGEQLRQWIDSCPNPIYSALVFQGGAAWREKLTADFAGDTDVLTILGDHTDDQLAALMENLGGHCVESIADAFDAVEDDTPTVFVAYTIKGMGLPLAGHKDNHAGLMTKTQMTTLAERMNVRDGHEWDRFEGLNLAPETLEAFLHATPYATKPTTPIACAKIDVPAMQAPPDKRISTQAAFGKLLGELARNDTEFSNRIVTTSPDVTVSTNLGEWVNRRRLFRRQETDDVFRDRSIPSAQRWSADSSGQHVELGIAEMNLFIALAAMGLSARQFGQRLFPVGTVYDPFIARGLDALNYACYQDARFLIVGTPSGTTLAPEGGAHQSIGTPMIAMSQPGLTAFEPAFTDELALVMHWAFEHMQAPGGGATYLRLSTLALDQPQRQLSQEMHSDILAGAYWLRQPGPNCELVIAYQGVIAPEAIAAAGLMSDEFRNIGVLAVTSADRLYGDWQHCRRLGHTASAPSHIEALLADVPNFARIVSVIDGHPATLGWLGAVHGHRQVPLGVDSFGVSGSPGELYARNGIDRAGIAKAASANGWRTKLRPVA